MQCGIMFKQREIVLVPIPFSDLTSSKKRPVVVISKDNYNYFNQDLLTAAITSNLQGKEFSILIESNDLEKGNLPLASEIRCDKIYSINKKIIIKKYGLIRKKILKEIKNKLIELI